MSASSKKNTRRHDKAGERNRVRASFASWSDEVPLNENEAAAAIGMSRPWLKRARQDGTGPEFLLINGSVIRYRCGALRRWLNEQAEAGVKSSRGGLRQPKPSEDHPQN